MGRGKRISVFLLCILLAAAPVSFSACGGNGGGGDETGDSEAVGEQIEDLFDGLTGGEKATVEEDATAPERDSTPRILENIADGQAVFDGNGAYVDYSYASDGYIMARYEGSNPKIKLQITKDGGETYTYDVTPNTDFAGFPLSQGGGSYNIAMFLNIEGDQYSQACAQAVQTDIADEFSPFLRANQYCNYTADTQAVAEASELANGAKNDLKVIENAFLYVIGNIEYDYDKATSAKSGTLSGYIPNVDDTLSSGKGICFDYAALMTCMLRTQGIPCQLVIGYAGEAYHAWISVYVEGVGWVANMIQFNGDQWTRMDPTFAASGDTTDPNIVGDGENYNPVYYY